jgi:hypothetical protein
MLKSWMRDIALAIQARSGTTPAVVVWIAIVAFAALTTFVFLCVAAYDWLALQAGSIIAGLIMAGVFLLIAIIGLIVCAVLRKRAKERAILERAAKAHAPSWLLDPRIMSAAVQIGREIGWQRIVPVALLGFMAAQWTRERRSHDNR